MKSQPNKILLKADTLEKEAIKYDSLPLTSPIFLNTLPKSGSHLLRNIFRMFVPIGNVDMGQCVQAANLSERAGVFKENKLIWGHLAATPEALQIATIPKYHILLVRDPYTWVLARARFMSSSNYGHKADFLKRDAKDYRPLVNAAIFGMKDAFAGVHDTYKEHVLKWYGYNVRLVKYEELLYYVNNLDLPDSEIFFKNLLSFLEELPSDWKERVKVGSDKIHSGTHRDSLKDISVEIPKELSDYEKSLVEFSAPGLRNLLGYR